LVFITQLMFSTHHLWFQWAWDGYGSMAVMVPSLCVPFEPSPGSFSLEWHQRIQLSWQQ